MKKDMIVGLTVVLIAAYAILILYSAPYIPSPDNSGIVLYRGFPENTGFVGIILKNIYGDYRIVSFADSSPAEAAGMRVGDVIVDIDGVSTDGLNPQDVGARLIGPIGSSAAIRVRRGDSTIGYQVIRSRTAVGSVIIPGYTGITLKNESGGFKVASVAESSPAQEADIRVGDMIVGIDGVPTVGLKAQDVGARLRGPVGSPVAVKVQRGDSTLDLNLVRGSVSPKMPITGYIGVGLNKTSGNLTVNFIADSSPAAVAGVRVGDVIQGIDGKKTDDLGLQDASAKIGGPAQSSVNLSVNRGGTTLEFTIVRAPLNPTP